MLCTVRRKNQANLFQTEFTLTVPGLILGITTCIEEDQKANDHDGEGEK